MAKNWKQNFDDNPTTSMVTSDILYTARSPFTPGTDDFGITFDNFQKSITAVGTITSGTWHGGIVGSTYGGTGVNNGTSTITLSGGTSGYLLTSDGSGNGTWAAPAYLTGSVLLAPSANQTILGAHNLIMSTGSYVAPTMLPGNLSLTGNTISSTNSNGNITVTPNGSGSLNVSADTHITVGILQCDNGEIAAGNTSGTPGSLVPSFVAFPPTGNHGSLKFQAVDNPTNRDLRVINASFVAQDTDYILPDPGTSTATFYLLGMALGTPASGDLANCNLLPVTGIDATGTPSASTFLRGDGSWQTTGGGTSLPVAPYVVSTVPGQGNFTTIQAAVDQAVSDGASSSTPFTVWILDGTYTEDLNLSNYVNLACASPLPNGGVKVIGSAVYGNGAGEFSVTNISFTAVSSNPAFSVEADSGSVLRLNSVTMNGGPSAIAFAPGATGVTTLATNCQFISSTGQMCINATDGVTELYSCTSSFTDTPSAVSGGRLRILGCAMTDAYITSSTGSLEVLDSYIRSGSNSCFLLQDSSSVLCTNSTLESGATWLVDGTSAFNYSSVVASSTATAFNPTLTLTAYPMKGSLTIDNISATGTPSSSTYLRGDGSWSTPPGGSGSDKFGVTLITDQSISPTTYTKVQYDNVVYDTASAWDAVNFRYTPVTAGYLQLNASIVFSYSISDTNILTIIAVYKNGALFCQNNFYYMPGIAGSQGMTLPTLVPVNGSTDYVEVFVYQSAGGSRTLPGSISIINTGLFLNGYIIP